MPGILGKCLYIGKQDICYIVPSGLLEKVDLNKINKFLCILSLRSKRHAYSRIVENVFDKG